MIIFEAIYEDLTHLGGPMGTEYTTEHSLGVYTTPEKAKAACERHFQKRGKISIEKASWKPNRFHPEVPVKGWIKDKKGWRTQDLSWAMYHVVVREVA